MWETGFREWRGRALPCRDVWLRDLGDRTSDSGADSY